jgi:hypothetical protein
VPALPETVVQVYLKHSPAVLAVMVATQAVVAEVVQGALVQIQVLLIGVDVTQALFALRLYPAGGF